MEGEVRRQVVVHQETQSVTDRIGDIHVHPVLQHPVDAVVERGGDDPHDTETQNLA